MQARLSETHRHDTDTPVASSTGAYPTFNFHVTGFGGKLCTTPYVNDREDPESLLKLAAEVDARIIYFANPDNPMGTWWPAETVQKLIDRVKAGRDGVHARAIVDGLATHGVFIRMPGVAPLNRCIRVSVGTEKDLDLLEEALPKVMAELD